MRTRIAWAFRWFGGRILLSFAYDHGFTLPDDFDAQMRAGLDEDAEHCPAHGQRGCANCP